MFMAEDRNGAVRVCVLTLGVTTGLNTACMISAKRVHADFGITL